MQQLLLGHLQVDGRVQRRAQTGQVLIQRPGLGDAAGKPSSRNPRLQSGWVSRSSIIATTTSSGTSSPESRYAWATSPSGVPSATLARRRSPVARCTSWNRAAIRSAWVPLPAPGGPSNKTRMR